MAFFSSDGPGNATQSITGVSGGGLTWHRAAMSNGALGDAEIWTALAPQAVSNVTVSANRAYGGYEGSITLAAFKNAASVGATAAHAAWSGAPSVSLTASSAGSVVWAVGHDWDNAIARSLGTGQSMVHQDLDYSVGDTSWMQRYNGTTSAGQTVTMSDASPTSDSWDLAAVEIAP